jgi:hypothetical protein
LALLMYVGTALKMALLSSIYRWKKVQPGSLNDYHNHHMVSLKFGQRLLSDSFYPFSFPSKND